MAKATLLQKLLNNPSQSYSFPPQKDYHSTKPALLKLATDGENSQVVDYSQSPVGSAPLSRSTSCLESLQGSYCNGLTSSSTTAPGFELHQQLVNDPDSDDDEFFTPRSSFYSYVSPPGATIPCVQDDIPQSFPSFSLIQPTPQTRHDGWESPSRMSSTSSLDSMSLQDDIWSETAETADTHSIFSSSLSTSTRVTTPLHSESGRSKGSNASGLLTAITISSAPSHVSSHRSSKRASNSNSTYTDEDWAREVRWLVTPDTSISANSNSTKTRRKKAESVILSRPTPLPLSRPDPPKSTKSRKNGRGKGRMSAVLEVSEDEDVAVTTSANISHAHRSSSLRLPSRSRSGSSSQGQRSLQSSKSPSPSRKYRTVVMPSPLPVPSSSDAQSMPSRGTTPYSYLTLPRASALPPSHALYSSSARSNGALVGANMLDKLKIEDSGKVDLTRSGMASTTMATIEVIKGGAETVRGRGISRSFSWKVKSQMKNVKQASSGVRDRSHSPTPSHLLSNMPSPLSFCSRHPPPTHVPSSHVLVQVWAVGLDGRDKVIVKKEKSGFVPGRSFVGRIIETGWDVSDDIIRKGEWVIGLIDVKKSGALAEFIVVDRHRIHRVPQPTSTNDPGSSPLLKSALTVGELALLPLCGVFAYRAVKTFEPSATTTVTPLSRESKRVLVLEGHEGTGALAVQMLARKGWNVVVQISLEAITSSSKSLESIERRLNSWGIEEVCFGDPLSVLRQMLERSESGQYVVDGVLDTIGGQDIWLASQQVLQRAPAISPPATPQGSGRPESTTPPQFTTLVGDDQARSIPTAQDHFKAGLRSLKRAMTSNCGYTWISVAADIDGDGLDVRHALAGIINWVEDTRGAVKPWTGEEDDMDPERRLMGMDGRVVVFEKTPQVFASGSRSLLNGKTVVIKIVG